MPGLTGLRGIAAIWVVFYHLDWIDLPVFQNGYLAVDLFFVLSGFVLSYAYADRFVFDLRSYQSFLQARLARVYPLHVFMLLVLAAIVLFLPDFVGRYPHPTQRFGAESFAASLLLVQDWFRWLPSCWNVPAWSLSAEWLAYLLFPAFLAVTQRWRSVHVPLLLAAASLALFSGGLLARGITHPAVVGTSGLVRMACEFGCGCLLFRAVANGLTAISAWPQILTLGALCAALLVPPAILVALPPLALLVVFASQGESLLGRLLSRRLPVFLGQISYSIYLLHWTVIQVSNWALARLILSPRLEALWDAGMFLLILALSYATYSFIEVPARRWVRSVAGGGSALVRVGG